LLQWHDFISSVEAPVSDTEEQGPPAPERVQTTGDEFVLWMAEKLKELRIFEIARFREIRAEYKARFKTFTKPDRKTLKRLFEQMEKRNLARLIVDESTDQGTRYILVHPSVTNSQEIDDYVSTPLRPNIRSFFKLGVDTKQMQLQIKESKRLAADGKDGRFLFKADYYGFCSRASMIRLRDLHKFLFCMSQRPSPSPAGDTDSAPRDPFISRKLTVMEIISSMELRLFLRIFNVNARLPSLDAYLREYANTALREDDVERKHGHPGTWAVRCRTTIGALPPAARAEVIKFGNISSRFRTYLTALSVLNLTQRGLEANLGDDGVKRNGFVSVKEFALNLKPKYVLPDPNSRSLDIHLARPDDVDKFWTSLRQFWQTPALPTLLPKKKGENADESGADEDDYEDFEDDVNDDEGDEGDELDESELDEDAAGTRQLPARQAKAGQGLQREGSQANSDGSEFELDGDDTNDEDFAVADKDNRRKRVRVASTAGPSKKPRREEGAGPNEAALPGQEKENPNKKRVYRPRRKNRVWRKGIHPAELSMIDRTPSWRETVGNYASDLQEYLRNQKPQVYPDGRRIDEDELTRVAEHVCLNRDQVRIIYERNRFSLSSEKSGLGGFGLGVAKKRTRSASGPRKKARKEDASDDDLDEGDDDFVSAPRKTKAAKTQEGTGPGIKRTRQKGEFSIQKFK
jgi:hypothetical protein